MARAHLAQAEAALAPAVPSPRCRLSEELPRNTETPAPRGRRLMVLCYLVLNAASKAAAEGS